MLLGDALAIIPEIIPSQSIDLAYIDPPFFTQSIQRSRSRSTASSHEFSDKWEDLSAYISWISELLSLCRDSLRPTGAIFLHCDWPVSHRIRVALDEVLGEDNFRNEIVWSYRKWTNSRASLQRTHQSIFYYSVSKAHQPIVPYVDYSPTTNLDQIWQARSRDERNISVYKTEEDGVANSGPKRGVPMGDVWDIPVLNPKAKERVGYPTQKPLTLLERVVTIGSNPGDVVLDPCCGSGTTLVAAKMNGRHWTTTHPNRVCCRPARHVKSSRNRCTRSIRFTERDKREQSTSSQPKDLSDGCLQPASDDHQSGKRCRHITTRRVTSAAGNEYCERVSLR